jgi:hypothetical protein
VLPLNDRVIRDSAVQLGLTHQRGGVCVCGMVIVVYTSGASGSSWCMVLPCSMRLHEIPVSSLNICLLHSLSLKWLSAAWSLA